MLTRKIKLTKIKYKIYIISTPVFDIIRKREIILF